MNTNPNCIWPNCGCDTAKDEPCRFDDPDFYINRERKRTELAELSVNALKRDNARLKKLAKNRLQQIRMLLRKFGFTYDESSAIK